MSGRERTADRQGVRFEGAPVRAEGGADVLVAEGIRVQFRTRRGLVTALSDASFKVTAGRFFVLVGESGSGKTVLAHALMRLLPRNAEVSGVARLHGRDLLGLTDSEMRIERRRRIAYIPQSPASALNPVRRVGSLLSELAQVRGLRPKEARAALEEALAELDLRYDQVADMYPHQLSGGMQQRVINSLALVGRPELVIADEPTSGLDADLVDTTVAQLRRIATRGAGVLVITHDLVPAERLGGTVALLYGSHIVETRASAAFFTRPAHPYGTGLLAARPERGGTPIPGLPPELTALPPGCPFAPRCAARRPGCDEQMPAPVVLGTAGGDGTVRCVLHAAR